MTAQLQIAPHPIRKIAMFVLGSIAVATALHAFLWMGRAHADTAAPPPTSTLQPVPNPIVSARVMSPDPASPADPGIPWQAWILVGLAALGGVEMLLRGARTLLGVIAPHTKTTVDDELRDLVGRMDDFVLEVRDALGGLVPGDASRTATSSRGTSPEPADATKPARVVGLGALLAILVGGAALQPACATVRPRAAAGAKAALDCEAPNLAAVALDGFALATSAILSTISGNGHPDAAALKAALGAIKSDGLRCAVSGAIAMLATPALKRADAPAAAELEVDGAELRAAFATVRDGWGVSAVRVAGTVL